MIYANGEFSGYACLFGEVAQGYGFTIAPGAFTNWLEEWVEAGSPPLPSLWNHDAAEPIGSIIEIRQDDTGLWVRGRLTLDVERAREVAALLQSGVVKGMSMGFHAGREEEGKRGEPDTIYEVTNLTEVSLVTFPALENAQVDGDNTMYFTDALELDDASIQRTPDGYLVAYARVARTGIQTYKGYEVGRPELPEVRVYRPSEEVFSDRAMASIAHKPITNNHPNEFVTARNWRKLSIGQIGGEVVRDGEFVRVPMVLMDEDAIKRFEDKSARQLSLGYTTELKWQDGMTPDGHPYDAVQTAIKANHLAVVAVARGGPQLRIGDTVSRGEEPMTTPAMRSILVDGVSLEVNDVSAAVIQRTLSRLEEQLVSLRKRVDEEEEDKKKAKDALTSDSAAHKKELEAKDGEIAALKQQVKDAEIGPDKIETMVRERTVVVDAARIVLGDAAVTEGKSLNDIRRQVVASKMGDDVTKTMSDASIEGAFKVLTADGTSTGTRTQHTRVMSDAFKSSGTGTPRNSVEAREQAYREQGDYLRDAWKSPGTKPARQ